jgi:hypothetical protein
MSAKILLLIGTKKGGFILESDADRREWWLREPVCESWPINHFTADPEKGALYAAGGSEWYGPAVWRSTDLGKSWSHSSEGLSYGQGGPDIKTVWSLGRSNGTLYAGVEPAGLFASEDGGATWEHVKGLRDHPSCSTWMPGGGGLCLHSIVPHPVDPRQMWVAISAAGTFHTADGGATWTALNRGVRADFMPEKYPEVGQCVHNIQVSPSRPDRLYQQNHCGVYRSDDGGASWEEITGGLPSEFGFPVAVHPRRPETVYVIPLATEGRYMPDGQAAVWRSQTAGGTWERLTRGLPQERAYLGVLRQALAVDRLDPAGLYFGTSTGHLYASADEGESWREIAGYLPPILSVEVAVVGD